MRLNQRSTFLQHAVIPAWEWLGIMPASAKHYWRTTMRLVLTALAIVITGVLVQPANADPYPWCAITGGRGDSRESCYFKTFQACLTTIQGLGGFCNPNPRYTGRSGYRDDDRFGRRSVRQ
jgi:hypothetical protein